MARSQRLKASGPVRKQGEGVCTVVLAAGQGSRYRAANDEDKLLAPSLSDTWSPPVIGATLLSLLGLAERTVVVVDQNNQPLRGWLEANASRLRVDVFPINTSGLGHSLSQAVARFPARRGWLVALGDMPYVREETLCKVAAAIDESSLVVPMFDGRRGHPRGIGTAHWAALLDLDGENGAQALFSQERVTEITADDPGVLQDVDVPQDRRSTRRNEPH